MRALGLALARGGGASRRGVAVLTPSGARGPTTEVAPRKRAPRWAAAVATASVWSARCGSAFSLALWVTGCGPSALPDPRVTAQRWAEAVEAGDRGAVYALLSEEARRRHGRDGVAQRLEADRIELVRTSRAVAGADARLETSADVSFEGDRTARVVLEDGRFRVAAATALPAGAQTPRDALRELRDVLSRRSFAGLLRVLTRDSAQSLEAGLQDLVEALAEPATVQLDVAGRRATARLPGGHTVTLELEDGIWQVKEFD